MNGMRVRIAGEGQPSPDGGPAGDAYCFIHVRQHKIFRREGSDLIVQVPLSYSQAALGTKFEIPTLDVARPSISPPARKAAKFSSCAASVCPILAPGAKGDLLVQTFYRSAQETKSAAG